MSGFGAGTPGVAFSPDGRLAAAVGGRYDRAEGVIRVWEMLSEEEVAVLSPTEQPWPYRLQFSGNQEVLMAGGSGLRQWDLETGENELLYEGQTSEFAASANGRRAIVLSPSEISAPAGRAVFLDLETGGVTPLDAHGDRVFPVTIDPTGTIAVTGSQDGVVRVGPVTGEEPHLLLGHDGTVIVVAIDPLGRWIASGGQDGTVRIWPMPDLSKPPLHTLSREELIAKLKTLTNLRVVRDPESATGWKLTHDPFPGWETVPEW